MIPFTGTTFKRRKIDNISESSFTTTTTTTKQQRRHHKQASSSRGGGGGCSGTSCSRICNCDHNNLHQQHALPASNKTTEATGNGNLSSSSSLILPVFLLLFMILISSVSCVVVYQVRFIATKNGRTDYALAGESVELSCHYIMKDEAEDIKQLIWSKDGKNILRWRKNKPGLEVLSYTFKGHIDPLSKHSHITIHNVTIDMHGQYKCSVKTDLGTHEIEQDLIVISQSNCKLNDWRVVSQPSECRELFRLDCRNMFPRPVPSCGLWNAKLDKFIRSVMVDISEEPNKQTYRVRYSDKFELPQPASPSPSQQTNGSSAVAANPLYSDLLQYAGHLMFKCDISVPETSWKLSLVHRMFDYHDGCVQDPLETIERMRLNYSHYAAQRMQQAGYLVDRPLDDFEMLAANLKYEFMPPAWSPKAAQESKRVELNCWQKPRIGSLARLSCAAPPLQPSSRQQQQQHSANNQVKLVGADLLECQSIGWVPVAKAPLSAPSGALPNRKLSRHRRPPRPSRQAPEGAGDDDRELSTEMSTGGSSNDLEAGDDGGAAGDMIIPDVEIIPGSSLQQESPDHHHHSQHHLSPAQLAPLLPACVSTRPRHITSNRLPLLDESVLASSHDGVGAGRRRPTSRTDLQQQHDSSIFSFSSSASRLQVSVTSGHHHSLLLALSLFVSALTCVITASVGQLQPNPHTFRRHGRLPSKQI